MEVTLGAHQPLTIGNDTLLPESRARFDDARTIGNWPITIVRYRCGGTTQK